MWSCLRKPAVIAVLLLASSVVFMNAATDPGVPDKAPAPQVERKASGTPPAQSVPPEQHGGFGFTDVRQLARARAAHEYRPPSQALPQALADLTYDQYRDIRYRPASALWHGQALFEVQFFHRGYRVRQRVNVFEVGPSGVNEVEYSPKLFTFGHLLKPPKVPADLGFAGFR